ncbi:MAG: FAD-binding oxidoreductase [Candidatus Melainabacteria bacterium]
MPPVVSDKHAKSIQAILRPLRQIVGKAFVLSEPEELAVYECDACLMFRHTPHLVVLPKTTAEVSAVVAQCVKHQVPFIARGAGTGLSGGALPVEGGIIIGLNRMNRIEQIDADNHMALVQPGVVNAWLNRDVSGFNLFFAPDPSSQSASTIGGNIAENAGGIHCIKYGVTVDHVLAMEMVLPDGSITWVGSTARQSNGLNLTGVLVGSEGTLGICTRALVRLLPKPASVKVFLVAFAATAHATDSVAHIIREGITPAALEFMDAFTVRAVNEAFNVGFPEGCEAVLLIELDGDPASLAEDETRLEAILAEHQALSIRRGTEEAERQKLWAARKGAVAAYGRYLPAFYLHDTVIPRSQLTTLLEKIADVADKYQLTIGNVFHAGDGNLHPNILFDPADPAMMKNVLAGGEEILKACLAVGGTLSGEHGIGLEKSEYMSWLYAPKDLERMHTLKGVFDADNLANPAKIFPSRRGCSEVRHALNDLLENPLENSLNNPGGLTTDGKEGMWI